MDIRPNIDGGPEFDVEFKPSSETVVVRLQYYNKPISFPYALPSLCAEIPTLGSFFPGFFYKDGISSVQISYKDEERLRMILHFVFMCKSSVESEIRRATGEEHDICWILDLCSSPQKSKRLLTLRADELYKDAFSPFKKSQGPLLAAIAAILAAYGSVHLSALHIIFPDTIERFLWKISCYYLLGFAGVTAVYSLLLFIFRADWLHKKKKVDPVFNIYFTIGRVFRKRFGNASLASKLLARGIKHLRAPISIKACPWPALANSFTLPSFIPLELIRKAIIALPLVVYFLARAYIVVESFISIRHVPVGVYETPNLNVMGSFPHL